MGVPVFFSLQGLFPHIIPDWNSGTEPHHPALDFSRYCHAEGAFVQRELDSQIKHSLTSASVLWHVNAGNSLYLYETGSGMNIQNEACVLVYRSVSHGCFSPEQSPSSSPSSSPRFCAIITTGIPSWWDWGEYTSSSAGNIAFTGTRRSMKRVGGFQFRN